MAYQRIIDTSAQSTDNSNVTTAGIDTSVATLIVVACAYTNGSTFTLSDSNGNTWTPLTNYAGAGSDVSIRLFYVVFPTVGAAHTFTMTGTSGSPFPAIGVAAYRGNKSAPFDQVSGNTNASSATIQSGSLTPAADYSLVFTGLGFNTASASIDGGFSELEDRGVTANAWGIAIAELIQTTAAAANPTWTQAGASPIAASMAVFLPGLAPSMLAVF